jgi:uncharacterized protein YdaU (DUF1376 family)
MADRPDTFMPIVVGDYLKDTSHLTTEQHGVYFLLLMAYWAKGGALPADDSRLAAIARLTPVQWAKHRPVLAELFREEDGLWINKRSELELEKARGKMAAKAAAGAQGAKARWQANGKRIADASVRHKQPDADAIPPPLANPMAEPMTKNSSSPSPSHKVSQERGETLAHEAPPDPRFLVFWAAYPKPDGDSQTAAAITWDALAKADQLPDGDDVAKAAERFAKDRAKTSNPPFAPHAKTWLIEKRWRDWAETKAPVAAPDWADEDPSWAAIKALANPGLWTAWMAKCEFDRQTCTLIAPSSLHVERIERLLQGHDLAKAFRKSFGGGLTLKVAKPAAVRQEAA